MAGALSAFSRLSAPQTVNYSYLVTNAGNVTLTGIALSDNNDANNLTCPKTTLAPDEAMTLFFLAGSIRPDGVSFARRD